MCTSSWDRFKKEEWKFKKYYKIFSCRNTLLNTKVFNIYLINLISFQYIFFLKVYILETDWFQYYTWQNKVQAFQWDLESDKCCKDDGFPQLKIRYVGLEGKLVVISGFMLADILCAGLNLASVCYLFTFTYIILKSWSWEGLARTRMSYVDYLNQHTTLQC